MKNLCELPIETAKYPRVNYPQYDCPKCGRLMQGGWMPFNLLECVYDGSSIFIPKRPFREDLTYSCPVCQQTLRKVDVGLFYFCQGTHCNTYLFVTKNDFDKTFLKF